jgi:hypothetical protein
MPKPIIPMGIAGLVTDLTPKLGGQLTTIAVAVNKDIELELTLECGDSGRFGREHPQEWATSRNGKKILPVPLAMKKFQKWLFDFRATLVPIGNSREFQWIYNLMIDTLGSCPFGQNCVDPRSWVMGRQGNKTLNAKWRAEFRRETKMDTVPELVTMMDVAKNNLWVLEKSGTPLFGREVIKTKANPTPIRITIEEPVPSTWPSPVPQSEVYRRLQQQSRELTSSALQQLAQTTPRGAMRNSSLESIFDLPSIPLPRSSTTNVEEPLYGPVNDDEIHYRDDR